MADNAHSVRLAPCTHCGQTENPHDVACPHGDDVGCCLICWPLRQPDRMTDIVGGSADDSPAGGSPNMSTPSPISGHSVQLARAVEALVVDPPYHSCRGPACKLCNLATVWEDCQLNRMTDIVGGSADRLPEVRATEHE